MTGWILLANARAGSARRDEVEAARSLLDEGPDVRVEVAWTESPADIDAALDANPGARVAVAGGDGSIHTLVNALHRRGELDRGCAVIPLGTGNDLVRGQELPVDAERSAGGLDHPAPRQLHTLRYAGGLVVNDLHVGAGARAAERADRWGKRFGPATYPLAAAFELLRPRSLPVRVTLDGVARFDGEAEAVFVATGPTIGGGMEIAPEADARDGHMEVVVLPRRRGRQRWRLLARYLRGGVAGAGLERWTGRELKISASTPDRVPMDVDGELDDMPNPLTVTVGPAWTLLVPAGAAAGQASRSS